MTNESFGAPAVTPGLDVFITVDVEVWCDGWNDLGARFPAAFPRYVHGRTATGDYGLPHILKSLGAHGLNGVFFVEPLFAARFGLAPLSEIVGLITDAGQEPQLHLHTEWVDEAVEPLLENVSGKRQHLRDYSVGEQTRLIAHGLSLMERAGAGTIEAFRAGSFAFNADTLLALRSNRVRFDSSYNACMFGMSSGVAPGGALHDVIDLDGVYEFPMTVFRQGFGGLRHAQLGACSFDEIEYLLWQALENRRQSFVILMHNFELLNKAKDRPDPVMVSRFDRLCAFLARHRDVFRSRGFKGLAPRLPVSQPRSLVSPWWKTGMRMAEQTWRRRYG